MTIKLPPRIRFALYALGVVVFLGITALSFFKVIDPEVAASFSAQLIAFLGLFGITISGTAAYNINKQAKDGTLDFQGSAPEQAVAAIQATVAAANQATAGLQKVRDAVSEVIKDTPVLGPLGSEIFDQITK